MPKYKAVLLKVLPSCNPEEAIIEFEADDVDAAHAFAESRFADPTFKPGWRSYGDLDLWGKEQETVVSIEEI